MGLDIRLRVLDGVFVILEDFLVEDIVDVGREVRTKMT